jgi:hypothetical protein
MFSNRKSSKPLRELGPLDLSKRLYMVIFSIDKGYVKTSVMK